MTGENSLKVVQDNDFDDYFKYESDDDYDDANNYDDDNINEQILGGYTSWIIHVVIRSCNN